MCDDQHVFHRTQRQIQTVKEALKLPAETLRLNCMKYLHVKEGKVIGKWQHGRGMTQFVVFMCFFSNRCMFYVDIMKQFI